jgi:hypothetical protein
MADKPKMRWFRTDVEEDFDRKLLYLANLRPLTGKGFYSVLRNLIYLRAPASFNMDSEAKAMLRIIMPGVSVKTFNDLLDCCFQVELLDREHYRATGEITSRRIQQEIRERFGDMGRKRKERQGGHKA